MDTNFLSLRDLEILWKMEPNGHWVKFLLNETCIKVEIFYQLMLLRVHWLSFFQNFTIDYLNPMYQALYLIDRNSCGFEVTG